MESNSFLEGLANLIALSVFLGAIWLVRVIFTVLGAGEAYLPCLAGVIFLGPIVAWIYYTVRRECFRYAGACSIYACGSRQYRFKAPGNREYTLTIPRVERELVTTGPPSGLPGVPSPGGAPQAELRG